MRYRVKNGLNWTDEQGEIHRYEIDDIADDIPAASIGWLVEQGHVEPADSEPPAPSAPTPVEEDDN